MLYSASELLKYKISGMDGDIGKITDFYFDDGEWTIRYAIVDINSWLPGGKVLISSYAFDRLDIENEKFHVKLTREQIKNSPGIDADEPISRQKQEMLHSYYNWPLYWVPMPYSGVPAGVPVTGVYPLRTVQSVEKPNDWDSHLRSFKEIENYTISTSTGELGKANDFIIQQDSWIIQYMVMNTGGLFSGKKVLLPVEWIKWVSWYQRKVAVWPTQENIKSCPAFEMEYPINQKHEGDLHKYYDCSKDW